MKVVGALSRLPLRATPARTEDWRWWTLIAIPGFVLLTLLLEFPRAAAAIIDGEQGAWTHSLLNYGICWLFWLLIGPLLFSFLCAIPIEHRQLIKRAGTHLLAAITFVLLHVAMHAAIDVSGSFDPGATFLERYGTLLRALAAIEVIIFLMIDGAFHAIRSAVRVRAAAEREQELSNLKVRAELEALRRRLEPHFLFNTLNSICAMIPEDAVARDMAVHLADYLRLVLDRTASEMVSVREELALVHAYLEIESLRHGDRLSSCFSVELEAMAALTPVMVLQPLVENAVRYATAQSRSPARVAVAAQLRGDQVVLTVSNDWDGGIDVPASGGNGQSIIRERLQAIYAGRARLTLSELEEEYVATVHLPYQEAGKQIS